MARLRHGPRADNQVGCPAIVAHGFKYGICRQRERPGGTRGDAEVVRLLAVGTDAPIVERTNGKPVAFGTFVDSARAHADALPAGDAAGVAMDAELADLVAVPRRRETHLAPHLRVVRTRGELFRRFCPGWRRG